MNALHFCLTTTLLVCSQPLSPNGNGWMKGRKGSATDRRQRTSRHTRSCSSRGHASAAAQPHLPGRKRPAPGAVIDPKEAEAAAKAQALKAEQEAHKAAEAKAQEDSKKEEAQRKAESRTQKKEQEVAKARQENCQRAKSTRSCSPACAWCTRMKKASAR